MVSIEFWYGTLLSGALFVVGSVISVFGADIRQYHLAWRKDRKLHGAALKISKLEQELHDHERMAADPAAAAAFFWSGLFLVIVVLMLLGLVAFITAQLRSELWRPIGVVFFAVAWLMAYTVANSLHRRAQALRRPVLHAAQLRESIEKLQARLS